MGRLTIRIDGEAYIEKVANKYCEEVCSSRNRCNDCPIRDAFNKLAHYEDLEEQGRLICLPCKVGDTVYVIDFTRAGYRIFEAIIEEVRCQSYGTYYCLDWGLHPQRFRSFKEENLGRNIFLTEEEAEAKLEKLKEGAE